MWNGDKNTLLRSNAGNGYFFFTFYVIGFENKLFTKNEVRFRQLQISAFQFASEMNFNVDIGDPPKNTQKKLFWKNKVLAQPLGPYFSHKIT